MVSTDLFEPLFVEDVGGSHLAPGTKPGKLIYFDCGGRRIYGRLRHLNRDDHHFGVETVTGKNVGHFGYKQYITGRIAIVQKTNVVPLPNRKLELVARFVDLEDRIDSPVDEGEERTLRAFLLWLIHTNYDVCRSDGKRLDMEALLMEYLSR